MTKQTQSTRAKSASANYTYRRNRSGSHDVFVIEDAEGITALEIHFVDQPNTSEAAIAEAKAKMLVAALNHGRRRLGGETL